MENNRIHMSQQQASGGFTLVELMVAMAIGGIVMAAVMTAFLSQHRTYLAQDDVVEMQQNARVAMDMLVRDIRMAGYNPTSEPLKFAFVDGVNFNNGSGVNTAVSTDSSQIAFTADRDGDGTVDRAAEDVNGDGKDMSDMEQIAFRLSGTSLQRYSTVTGAINWQAVAENINQLEFRYLKEDGSNLDVSGNFAATSGDILSIQVSLMVQTPTAAVNGPPAQKYTTPSGAIWTSTPGFRSRYLSTTVQCRNLGL